MPIGRRFLFAGRFGPFWSSFWIFCQNFHASFSVFHDWFWCIFHAKLTFLSSLFQKKEQYRKIDTESASNLPHAGESFLIHPHQKRRTSVCRNCTFVPSPDEICCDEEVLSCQRRQKNITRFVLGVGCERIPPPLEKFAYSGPQADSFPVHLRFSSLCRLFLGFNICFEVGF